MAKAKARQEAQPPPDIELAYTGEEALKRLTDMTRQIVAVPRSEIAKEQKQFEKRREKNAT